MGSCSSRAVRKYFCAESIGRLLKFNVRVLKGTMEVDVRKCEYLLWNFRFSCVCWVFCVWGVCFLFWLFKNTKMHSEIYSHSGCNAYLLPFGKMTRGSTGGFPKFLLKLLGLGRVFLCFAGSAVLWAAWTFHEFSFLKTRHNLNWTLWCWMCILGYVDTNSDFLKDFVIVLKPCRIFSGLHKSHIYSQDT